METAVERFALRSEQLRRSCDPSELPFDSTAEVAPLEDTIGQPRAIDAIEFALEIGQPGFNLFVSGAPGSGRASTVLDYLERFARTRPAPSDWVYVHSFDEPDHPDAIRLPAGKGVGIARDMDELLRAALQQIPRAFESEDYDRRRREALAEIARQRDTLLHELGDFSEAQGFGLEITPVGIVSVPLINGRPIAAAEFEKLRPEQRRELELRHQEIQSRIASTVGQMRRLDKQAVEAIRTIDRDVALFVVGPLLDELREKYRDQPEVLTYLDHVKDDLPEHLDDFRGVGARESELPAAMEQLQGLARHEHLTRYRVNVLIDNSRLGGAPVVVERNPTYYNLMGRVDYRATFGAMVTDFRQIRPGALHRANGGFLVLHVLDVLRSPFSWEALKRALLSREIRIENLGEQLMLLPSATLRPEPISLDLKVVLIGPPLVYHLLYQLDEDFRELFKVKSDFAPDMDWNHGHVRNYAAFISRCVRDMGLRHFDRTGVARVVEHGARLRDHQRKLSTRLLDIVDVVTEASFWAARSGHELVAAEDVDRAVTKREHRSSLIEERVRELISDGTIMIDITGERVAQVNGISVVDLGDYLFGIPSRITARVALGRGSVQSVEREIKLSGPIHSKGFLILTGYLSGKYAQEWPLALASTITFEQSYDEVEGDSASSTELYALLSALSGLPLRQGIAVTGSVNQHGEVQAVGGVTRKIEGFFEVCRARGLTGDQGVIIPATNGHNLMLNEEVTAAVRAGEFHVWAVRTVDEGIELLTGRPAGERGVDDRYPPGSVHQLVEDRLRRYAEELRAFGVIAGSSRDSQGGPYDGHSGA